MEQNDITVAEKNSFLYNAIDNHGRVYSVYGFEGHRALCQCVNAWGKIFDEKVPTSDLRPWGPAHR